MCLQPPAATDTLLLQTPGYAGYYYFNFSIFLESFDHWLPRLTNESSDRVTCVPPCPLPTRPPAGPAGLSCANFLLVLGGGGEGRGRTRHSHHQAGPAGGGGRCWPGPPSWAGGCREFCGAGGDRLGQPPGFSRVAPDSWVCEHQQQPVLHC